MIGQTPTWEGLAIMILSHLIVADSRASAWSRRPRAWVVKSHGCSQAVSRKIWPSNTWFATIALPRFSIKYSTTCWFWLRFLIPKNCTASYLVITRSIAAISGYTALLYPCSLSLDVQDTALTPKDLSDLEIFGRYKLIIEILDCSVPYVEGNAVSDSAHSLYGKH